MPCVHRVVCCYSFFEFMLGRTDGRWMHVCGREIILNRQTQVERKRREREKTRGSMRACVHAGTKNESTYVKQEQKMGRKKTRQICK